MFMDLYQEDPLKCVTLYDGILPLLHTLKSNGILLAILSNKPHLLARLSVPKLFGEHLFDVWYGQRDEVPRKPAPDGALMIARELLVQPSQCLFIGDSDVDMHTGNNAGMKTAGVLWGYRSKEELLHAGAQMIASTPSDIQNFIFQ